MTITLTLPYDLSREQWATVDRVFKSMEGWRGTDPHDNTPRWYGDESADQFIWASIEPSRLLVEGKLEPGLWTGWISVLCARLTLALQMEVRDAEM